MAWSVDKKTINLGYYNTEKEAALAYDEFAFKKHGKFAQLNFPIPLYILQTIRKEVEEMQTYKIHEEADFLLIKKEDILTYLTTLEEEVSK